MVVVIVGWKRKRTTIMVVMILPYFISLLSSSLFTVFTTIEEPWEGDRSLSCSRASDYLVDFLDLSNLPIMNMACQTVKQDTTITKGAMASRISFWKNTRVIVLPSSWTFTVRLSRKQSTERNYDEASDTGLAVVKNCCKIGGQERSKDAVIVRSWKWFIRILKNTDK